MPKMRMLQSAMPEKLWSVVARLWPVGAVLLLATLVSCSGGTSTYGGTETVTPDGSAGGAAGDAAPPAASAPKDDVAAAASFPTGPAVVIPVGYEPPDDRVDSTGAYLPANGKPTLVYVDAIW